jgi:predicted secreted protein
MSFMNKLSSLPRHCLRPVWIPVLLALLWCFPATARAGDIAEREILGFSPDGRHFAFEQFGVQDGSGFPYADIFVIDTKQDAWVEGTPFRVLLRDDRAGVESARQKVHAKSDKLLKDLEISQPGHLLASNPSAELSADPHAVTIDVRHRILTPREPWRFELEEIPIEVERCTVLLEGPAKGFRLTVRPHEGSSTTLHKDTAIPESRGCPMRYAFSDVIMHEPEGRPRVFAILISVYRYGFEGADRRFIAVTHVAN